jgi:predicted DNA-binding transcriptional regulator AlpA
MMTDNDVFLSAAEVRKRYGGRSDMWLWRQLRYDPDFPRPIIINTRRYWWLSSLKNYESLKGQKSQ